jgi:DNA-binding CsgD family transcriptional regulator
LDQHLSADALCLYKAIARQDWVQTDELTQRNPQALEDLTVWGLISFDQDDPDRPVVRNPAKAMRELMQQELAEAAARVERLSALPDIADELTVQYRAVQLRAGGSSQYLEDPVVVNARIREVVGCARHEILAAQPGGPRSKEVLELAVERDAAALDRGVELRTIYRDTVRDHAMTGEYARAMSTRACGKRAQYRTLVGSFARMIIVDREQAFIPDLIVAGSPEHSAWHVTDRAVVAVLAEVFDSKWRLGDPWHGELRPRRGRTGVDTVSSVDGVVTTARQREILRSLVAGMSRAAVARTIGVSNRTLEEEIAGLKRISGSDTPMQLAFWFAHCPDRLIDDSASSEGDALTTAAVA